jgi:hypothetical protein
MALIEAEEATAVAQHRITAALQNIRVEEFAVEGENFVEHSESNNLQLQHHNYVTSTAQRVLRLLPQIS